MIIVAEFNISNAPRPTAKNAARGKARLHPHTERARQVDETTLDRFNRLITLRPVLMRQARRVETAQDAPAPIVPVQKHWHKWVYSPSALKEVKTG